MPTIKIHWIGLKHHKGFQSIVWTFVRHIVSRCLTFLALPEVARPRGQVLANSCVSSRFILWWSRREITCSFPPVPAFRSIWVVLWLLFFRSASSTFPSWAGYPSRSLFPWVPSHLDYTQKSAKSILAVKLPSALSPCYAKATRLIIRIFIEANITDLRVSSGARLCFSENGFGIP